MKEFQCENSEEHVSEDERRGSACYHGVARICLQHHEHCLTQDKSSVNIFLTGNHEGRREGNEFEEKTE